MCFGFVYGGSNCGGLRITVTNRDGGRRVGDKSGWLTRNILALSFVSLLNDTASEMVVPLLPAFLTGVLGASASVLGWMEGLADAAAGVLKFYSGWLADRRRKRLPLVAVGYALPAVARPLIALATAGWQVITLRLLDRVGKGLRASPRDALLAASVAPAWRGTAFGLNRAMDHAGAVLGPLAAILILTATSGRISTVFWFCAIPGAAAVAVTLLFVRESSVVNAEARPSVSEPTASSGKLLVRFLIPLGVFTLANASDLFILLKLQTVDTPLFHLPLMWMLLHVVKTLAAFPGGRLADLWGYRKVIGLGWLLYSGVYAGLALAQTQQTIWALFMVYGCFHGLTEAAEKALVAETVPAAKHGTGFGWYHLTVGLLTLLANALFGFLWESFGPGAAFATGSVLALIATAALAVASCKGGTRWAMVQ
jgi:MFS family permease